uniref:Sushi domain-containing protein n=1 Tax=Magallana gigas TaxID=29159 RepID=K1PQX6_MAGGI
MTPGCPWHTLTVNGTSPVYIPHPLGEIPGKVDVQVKVVEAGQEYIFPGIGSGQSDDDILAEYGGVAYLYNDVHVKVFIPIEKSDSAGIGRIVTTGPGSYSGPFQGTFVTGSVRIRAWRSSDWPTPNHETKITISNSAPHHTVPHCLGTYTYPDFVTAQVNVGGGYVTEATGVVPLTVNDGGLAASLTNTEHICGVVYAITQTSITIWSPNKNNDFVTCFSDGWGASLKFSSADVIVKQWILSPFDLHTDYSFTLNSGDATTGRMSSLLPIDLDNYLVSVQARDTTVSNGRMFHASGSVTVGRSGENFGGVVYGYTSSEVLLWTPSAPTGHLIYVGGVWGGGVDSMAVNDAQITIKVVKTGGAASSTVWSSPLPAPVNITNADVMVECNYALYSCREGYYSNGASSYIVYDGQAWSSTAMECRPVPNPANATPIEEIVRHLKISKTNTSAYERSLKCAYDPRPSSTAIGGVGVAVLCLFAALIIIADCEGIYRNKELLCGGTETGDSM